MKNIAAKIYFSFYFFYIWFSQVGFGLVKMREI